ncbi:protein flbB [Aspergillus vadensis CBS 113365]|uniref:BZIP-type transcription factor n=1 Tax=Aspergillus vadensis (strain CBS 113365 / IMI 142717 / IBT 24658) TaxID=1448311 RepID=A0A319B439_ASPVC|nr:bZIP-type transcription factor [Aspergillus vadensis CBS 113365]PYH67229.1 bZIP-type transcription factor [Aspergillus vadensis CBS 113365]
MTSINGGPISVDLSAGNRQTMTPEAMPSQPNSRPSTIGADFFKFFSGTQKKVTRDGQPAKRRGPKPDSKPALTRRQELNRQAQRTHRERKEQYIRALETEVSRLREAYTQEISAANLTVVQHRDMVQSLSDENAILKDILTAHGINYEPELERRKAERPTIGYQSSPFASSSTGSQPTGVAPSNPSTNNMYTTPPTTVSASLSPITTGIEQIDVSSSEMSPPQGPYQAAPCDALATLDQIAPVSRAPRHPSGIFEEHPQLQIDFILTLESPCREHTDYLCRRSITEADDEDMPFSGHALMATCPPPSYIATTSNEQTYPHKTYDLPHANLSTLLNLSRQLVTDGQITPIMALQCLKNHELYRSLTKDDVKVIIETLNTKVRCYGFGAVVEDFELMDCLSSVLGAKVEGALSHPGDEMMYS